MLFSVSGHFTREIVQINKVVTHAFLKEEHHVYTEQMGEEQKGIKKTLGSTGEKMATVQNSSRAL